MNLLRQEGKPEKPIMMTVKHTYFEFSVPQNIYIAYFDMFQIKSDFFLQFQVSMSRGQEPQANKRKRPGRPEKEKALLAVQELFVSKRCFVRPQTEDAGGLDV